MFLLALRVRLRINSCVEDLTAFRRLWIFAEGFGRDDDSLGWVEEKVNGKGKNG